MSLPRHGILATALLAAVQLHAAPSGSETMPFTPIDGEKHSVSGTWQLPAGYQQQVISDERRLDIYPGSDWNDMITDNAAGADAGRYLYRTHEVRPGLAPFPGGAVSVMDRRDGSARVLVQRRDWEALDGIVRTPWGTLLVGEETGAVKLPDPEVPQARHGLVYEISLDGPTRVKTVTARPLLGAMSHEGIALDDRGWVYLVDEYAAGGIYRFVPDRHGDLSSGELYALVLDADGTERTGPAHWLKLERAAVQVSARAAAAAAGASTWNRPEDLERIGDTLYVAVTGEHSVLAVSLGERPRVSRFVSPANADRPGATFRQVDNLAAGPDGRLWMIEDNIPSDIWVADPDRDGDGTADRVRLFASFNDGAAEGTGIYFGQAPHTLFVNLQHTADGNDRTLAIRRVPPSAP